MRSSTPARRSAETVSPPPATLRSAPFPVASATALANAVVATSKGGVSKAPSGPFHTTVRQSPRCRINAATVTGPTSRIIASPGTAVTDTVWVGTPGFKFTSHDGIARQHDLAARRPGARKDVERGRMHFGFLQRAADR